MRQVLQIFKSDQLVGKWRSFQGQKWEEKKKVLDLSGTFYSLLKPPCPVPGLSPASYPGKSLSSSSTQNHHRPFLFPPTQLLEQPICLNPASSHTAVSWIPMSLLTSPDLQCLTKLPGSPILTHSYVKCPLPPPSFAYIVKVPQASSEINFQIYMPSDMLMPSLYPTIVQINHCLKTAFTELWTIHFVPSHLNLLEAFDSGACQFERLAKSLSSAL